MREELEMDIRPLPQSTETGKEEVEVVHKGQLGTAKEEEGRVGIEEAMAKGGKRSRLRMVAIITALFVSLHVALIPHLVSFDTWNLQSLYHTSQTDSLTITQLSLFVSALDATIVATALPTISRDLNSAAGYTWIGGAYLLANAASGPIWAKLSDIWGRKPIMLAALTIFFVSSAVCATAKTMQELIIGRAFQGTAGGGLILLVHVCISDLFSLRQRSLLMVSLLFFLLRVTEVVGVWCRLAD
jgi:hypothetical protein